jgi:hypothetical protein
MLALAEIEQKIRALKKRLTELDDKLVPKRDGKIDGSVSSAMGIVTKEIGRLESLRQQALISDLIGKSRRAKRAECCAEICRHNLSVASGLRK